jgi:DNA-binding XRE family transcriptional regulator
MMKKRFVHPLRAVRKATGKSRPHFGALIGCTEHSIKRIENGRLPLSKKLAEKIRLATGANSYQLHCGKTGKALDWWGQPYSPESFKRWQNRLKKDASEHHNNTIDNILRWVKFTLEIARQTEKFEPIAQELADCLNSIRGNFNLGPAVDRELKSRKKTETDSFFARDLRECPDLARAWGVKPQELAKHGDSDVINVAQESWLVWNPAGGFPADR